MSKQTLALLSRDSRLTAGLPAELGDDWAFVICDALEDAELLFAHRRPAVVVCDFRSVRASARVAERFVEQLRDRLGDVRCLAILPDGESSAASSLGEVVAPETSVGRLADLVRRPAEEAEPTPPPASTPGVLKGITRQFETDSPRLREMLAELEVAADYKSDATNGGVALGFARRCTSIL